jgi:hypothetical protein
MKAGNSATQLLPIITFEPFGLCLLEEGEDYKLQALLVFFPGEDSWLPAISLFPFLKEIIYRAVIAVCRSPV